MNKLLQETWDILKKNPNLYTPPALLLILSGFIDPAGISRSLFFLVSIVTFVLIHIAMTAGWLNQIKVVLASKEQKSNFDDVLMGIGKYSKVLVAGNFVFFGLAFGLFFLYMLLVNNLIGMSDNDIRAFQGIWAKMRTIKEQQELVNYVKGLEPGLVMIAYKWTTAMLFYAGLVGLFYFFISLWAQSCVLRGFNFLEGWKRSYQIVKKNLGLFTVLSLVQGCVAFLLMMMTVFMQDAFTQILLTIMNIITDTYFTVLFCLFIIRFDNDDKIELLKDEIQSPISEIQGPDSKK